MNEKLQYASMLEIPVNTCNVTYKPIKKRRLKRKKHPSSEEVKNELLKKVNAAAENEISPAEKYDVAENRAFGEESENAFMQNAGRSDCSDCVLTESSENQTERSGCGAAAKNVRSESEKSERENKTFTVSEKNKKHRKKLGISAIGVELAVIGALVAVIFLTSAFYPQSGVNAFIKSVFGTKEVAETIDERTYDEFAPVITTAVGETLSVEDGAVVIGGKGSVYSPLGGVVKSVTADGNGRFNIEIAHSGKFSTIISGIDYAYAAVGDKVFGNIPVGYVKESGVKMCFTGENGAAITDYELSGNAVVWAV